jgi:hypothetical protein
MTYIGKNRPTELSSFPVYFKGSSDNPIIKNIKDEIEGVFVSVSKSPALPDEYKMKNGKRFTYGTLHIPDKLFLKFRYLYYKPHIIYETSKKNNRIRFKQNHKKDN